MQTKEIRVRPVIRHIVTEYRDDGVAASVATVGEFANEEQAEKVAAALRGQNAPRLWIAVECTFIPLTNVLYFQTEAGAKAFAQEAAAAADPRQFDVFARAVQGIGYASDEEKGPAPQMPPRVTQ